MRGGNPTDPSDQADRTHLTENAGRPARLRPSGGYRKLRSFQAATFIYDATVSFCHRLMDPRSRTVDQMVQAAWSGRQNIAEGSLASAASSQAELRLVSVARASLDELLLDYEDFLRQRGLPQWAKDTLRRKPCGRWAGKIRRFGRTRPISPMKSFTPPGWPMPIRRFLPMPSSA